MTSPQCCPVCGTKSTLKCSGCRNVVYCGKKHQKEHWRQGHKFQCRCFEIAKNDTIGRYMKATRDIKKGEIILCDNPIIIGPKLSSFPICLGCHKMLQIEPGQKDFYKCSKCTWPLCGPGCESSKHHVDECKLMHEKKFVYKQPFTGELKKESSYCVITPLRALLLKSKKPEIYKDQFKTLVGHLEKRIKTPLYQVLKANLVTFIHTVLGMSEEFTEEEILSAAAILDTNVFEIRLNGTKLRGLYPAAAMAGHDCTPNTKHTFNDNMQLLFIASVDISKGEQINASYTNSLKSTLMRREHLLQSKCFECTCSRCSDPTELGTFAGAIYCSKCKVGMIVSSDPLDNSAKWSCKICSHEIPARQISLGNSSLSKEIESLDKNSPKRFEEFLISYKETLHPKNTHALQVKYALVQLYGNVKGFLLHELTDAAVQRKIELCEELLEIGTILEPGWTHFRGVLLLDLQEIMAVQTKREYNTELITKEAAQGKLLDCMSLLEEAVQILKLEPGMSDILEKRVQKLTKEMEME